MINLTTQVIPLATKRYLEEVGPALEGLVFGLFILSTAALTGMGFAWAINKNQTRRAKTIGLIVIVLSLVGGMLIGFTTEELFLVCLPQGIGYGILCSWFLGCKNTPFTVDKDVDLMADF
jgi:O-antigen/teichoic acid export membrane protein